MYAVGADGKIDDMGQSRAADGEATVKTHIARIFATLAVRDRAQAVVLAYETGLVIPDTNAASWPV